MISREAAGAVLDRMGLRRVDQESWMGFTRAAGRDLNISAHLKPIYVQIMVPLNLYTRCDQVPLYEYMLEANSRTALGKFVVGPELPVGGRPIVLVADLPAVPGPTYTTEEAINLLFQSTVQLLDEHLDRIERVFRQGCRPGSGSGPGSGSRTGQGILDRLRVFRGGHEGHAHSDERGREGSTANGDMLSNAEVEAALLAVGLKWVPGPREGVWVLPFHNADTGTGELVLVDNGIGNEGFVGVQIGLGTVTNNPDCTRKVLCLANGFLALAKLSVDGKGEITVRVVGPRQRGMFQQEMLKHLVGPAMAAAAFVRPLLTACTEDDRCDAADAFMRRVTEVSGRGPVFGPPRPPG